MWILLLECINTTITGSVGAAAICTSLAQHLSTRESEVYSEFICWMILPAIITRRQRASSSLHPVSPKSSATSLWVVGMCLAATCWYKAEFGSIALLPVLTPLLLLSGRPLLSSDLACSGPADLGCLLLFGSSFWCTGLTAFILVFCLSDWSLVGCDLSLLPVAGLLLVYVTLGPETGRDRVRLSPVNIEEMIVPLSCRILLILLATLGVQAALLGVSYDMILPSLPAGVAKSLSWYFTIQAARHTSWSIAPRIATFAIMSTRNPYMESSELQCLLSVIASFLALTQVISFCPKQAKYRSALWLCALISVLPYTANIIDIQLAEFSSSSSFDNSSEHPVDALFRNANAEYEALLKGQSKSYTAAYDEYRRRYAVEPPPGFEGWYNFSVQHASPIIDNFDIIFDTISPLWKLSGIEVNTIMSDVLSTPNIDMWNCVFSGEQAETRCTHPFRTYDRNFAASFNDMLGKLEGVISDVRLLVNHLDEPRIFLPPAPSGEDRKHFEISDLQRIPNWDVTTKFCGAQETKNMSHGKNAVELFEMPFVTDLVAAMDPCRHPEYSSLHGLFMSPTSFSVIEGLVPVLSTGAPFPMGDLLIPSPAYNESGFRYEESQDIEWDKKNNKLYWAGSTTGGFAADDQWRHFHRQRFVALAQNLKPRQHLYLRARAGVVHRVASSFLNRKLYDVSFTQVLQCHEKSCRGERVFFRPRPWADKDEALHSRLVFDIDGNGISGRYYKLLASRSVPLKQTLFREWHDERLVPWVHYVPVSQGMEELSELVLYLTSTKSGQRKAKEIADHGRDWFSKAFRDVDRTIYMYRLLLELARLQDPSREAS